jgi:CRISPR system Cascade subunit CasD
VSDWLVVVLAAPLASFGEDAGNARRGTAERPTHSALVGLAGAALGVERGDKQGQLRLAEAFFTATRTLRPGAPMTDFHTFQSLPAAKGPVATRVEALARRGELETSITRRDYRSDGLWQAAFTPRPGGELALDALRDAFARPRFPLYAGRRSCPLAFPLSPLLVTDASVDTAFYDHARQLNGDFKREILRETGGVLAIDARLPEPSANTSRRHRRNDEPGDRTRWHFSPRAEIVRAMSADRAATDNGRS